MKLITNSVLYIITIITIQYFNYIKIYILCVCVCVCVCVRACVRVCVIL